MGFKCFFVPTLFQIFWMYIGLCWNVDICHRVCVLYKKQNKKTNKKKERERDHFSQELQCPVRIMETCWGVKQRIWWLFDILWLLVFPTWIPYYFAKWILNTSGLFLRLHSQDGFQAWMSLLFSVLDSESKSNDLVIFLVILFFWNLKLSPLVTGQR